MNRISRLSKTLLITVVVMIAVPAVALAITKTASHDGIKATLTYKHGRFNTDKDMKLKIVDKGQPTYDAAVKAKFCGGYCELYPKRLTITKLGNETMAASAQNGPQEAVVVPLFSGGAHCCFIDAVYWLGSSGWVHTNHDFGDPGARLKPIGPDGIDEFVTADDSFAYTFASYAESGLPIKILSFHSGKFTDVTVEHPELVRTDAKLYWHAYLSDHDAGRAGLIAAWTADEYNLYRPAHANQTLAKQAKLGKITEGFVIKLKKFLKHQHYPTSSPQLPRRS